MMDDHLTRDDSSGSDVPRKSNDVESLALVLGRKIIELLQIRIRSR